MVKDPQLASYADAFGKPKGKRLVFVVKGGLHYIKGNSSPHFSITANGYDHGFEFGGCCHDIILKHFPKFADLVALHLSDINGAPMHDDANGWYDLAGYIPMNAGERYHRGNSPMNFPITPPKDKPWQTTKHRLPTPEECLQMWAKHLRIDLEQARTVAADIMKAWNWPDMRKAHKAFVESLRPMWKEQAEACIKKHNLVVYGDEWNPEK